MSLDDEKDKLPGVFTGSSGQSSEPAAYSLKFDTHEERRSFEHYLQKSADELNKPIKFNYDGKVKELSFAVRECDYHQVLHHAINTMNSKLLASRKRTEFLYADILDEDYPEKNGAFTAELAAKDESYWELEAVAARVKKEEIPEPSEVSKEDFYESLAQEMEEEERNLDRYRNRDHERGWDLER